MTNIDTQKIADNANDAADTLDRDSARDARRQHNCRVFSRGFEFLSLDANGERDENVIDYIDRDEMDADAVQSALDDCRRAGSVYLAIGYGVDIAECERDYDAGIYEPMFDWVDLPNIMVS